MGDARVLALVPARGGSKALPGKNIYPFCGLPLLAHTLLCAKLVPEISRVVVSSDSPEILSVAAQYGPAVRLARPLELATDESPVWDTVRHALVCVEDQENSYYEYLVLLEATSPLRKPRWVSEAIALLVANPEIDGVHGVSEVTPNPVWNAMVLGGDGRLEYLIPSGRFYHRRQDVPPTYRMDGSLHVWRTRFIRQAETGYQWGKYLGYVTDPARACSIDVLQDLKQAEWLVTHEGIALDWLDKEGPYREAGACGE